MNSAQPIRVLVIDDSQQVYKSVKSALGKERHFTYHTQWAESLSEGLALLSPAFPSASISATDGFDLVLSALCLADSPQSGDTLSKLGKDCQSIPLMILCSAQDEQLALQALQRGAQDYILTEQLADPHYLSRSIQHVRAQKQHAIELRQLQQELAASKEALEGFQKYHAQDILAAAEIQTRLLPKTLEPESSKRCAWRFESCAELAGDLLNVFALNTDQTAFYLLDVSGHGLSSVFLSMHIHQTITEHNYCLLKLEDGSLRECNQVLEQLNQLFPMQKPLLRYFTMIYGIYTHSSGKVSYASAGHPVPFIHKAEGHVVVPESSGTPIGMLPQSSYLNHRISLDAGDRLFIGSDALYECTDLNNEQFGRRRLVEHIQKHQRCSLDTCLNEIMHACHAWLGHAPQVDDFALLAFEQRAP